jgi:hypothetical protein
VRVGTREHGLEGVSAVRLGVLEPDGSISIVPLEADVARTRRRVRYRRPGRLTSARDAPARRWDKRPLTDSRRGSISPPVVTTAARLLLVSSLLVALAGAACGESGSSGGAGSAAASAAPSPAASASSPAGIQAVPTASQLLVGLDRFPIGVLNHHTPVNDAAVHVRAYAAAGGSIQLRSEADAPFKGEGLEGRGLYVAHLRLDTPGQWLAEISVRLADGTQQTLPVPFKVLTQSSVPVVGQPAPHSRNLTARDVSDVSTIDSGTPPDDMHALSIADAIAQHRPALVVFATPAFCESATCGPQVHAVQQLEPAYRDRLAFIHVEIYRDFKPDPSKRQLSPTVLEWHLQTEPWVFLIDGRGIVAAVFEGTAATDELKQAVDQLLAAG